MDVNWAHLWSTGLPRKVIATTTIAGMKEPQQARKNTYIWYLPNGPSASFIPSKSIVVFSILQHRALSASLPLLYLSSLQFTSVHFSSVLLCHLSPAVRFLTFQTCNTNVHKHALKRLSALLFSIVIPAAVGNYQSTCVLLYQTRSIIFIYPTNNLILISARLYSLVLVLSSYNIDKHATLLTFSCQLKWAPN